MGTQQKQKKFLSQFRWAATASLLLVMTGCGGGADNAEELLLDPVSPNITYADQWLEITMMANSAKTTISTVAHFSTTRNKCGKDAYGAINDLAFWNEFTKNMNIAVKAPPIADEYCVDSPSQWPRMDGTVDAKTEAGKRSLFWVKGGQVCSTIRDPGTAAKLLAAYHKIVLLADAEDCPNGWGS